MRVNMMPAADSRVLRKYSLEFWFDGSDKFCIVVRLSVCEFERLDLYAVVGLAFEHFRVVVDDISVTSTVLV